MDFLDGTIRVVSSDGLLLDITDSHSCARGHQQHPPRLAA
jgi:hypothetical protein